MAVQGAVQRVEGGAAWVAQGAWAAAAGWRAAHCLASRKGRGREPEETRRPRRRRRCRMTSARLHRTHRCCLPVRGGWGEERVRERRGGGGGGNRDDVPAVLQGRLGERCASSSRFTCWCFTLSWLQAWRTGVLSSTGRRGGSSNSSTQGGGRHRLHHGRAAELVAGRERALQVPASAT